MSGQPSLSALKMIASPEFTSEMALNYLHEWREDEGLVGALLGRIERAIGEGQYHLIPTVV